MVYTKYGISTINKKMNKANNIGNLIQVRKVAEEKMKKMSSKRRKSFEFHLDVEHAYYSSALEGSKLDRKTFEELGKKIPA